LWIDVDEYSFIAKPEAIDCRVSLQIDKNFSGRLVRGLCGNYKHARNMIYDHIKGWIRGVRKFEY